MMRKYPLTRHRHAPKLRETVQGIVHEVRHDSFPFPDGGSESGFMGVVRCLEHL